MRNLKSLTILFSILVFLISCGKDDDSNNGLLDERENSIMNECFEKSLASKAEIENNLIGKWTLIGYSQTLFQENPQPNIILNFSDSEVVFENITHSIIDTLQWELEERDIGSEKSFLLTTESNYTELGLQVFCENYMYLQTLALSSSIGYTYIYEKIE